MNQYLLSILKEFNTIIIPGIGALTITDAKTGEIMFMSYLKHDDGKLAEYIANHDGIDKTEAQNIIAKYVREIENMLNKGEEYSMYELGTFVKENDDIVFKAWDKEVSAKEVDPEVISEEKIEENKDEVSRKEETKKTEEKKEEPVKEKEIEKVEDVKPKATSTVTPIREPSKNVEEKVNLVEENSFTPKKELNILEKEEKEATQEKLDQLKTKKEDKKPKKKISGAKLVLVVLLLFIGVGGVYFGMNYDELKQHVPFLADKEIPSEENSDTEEDEQLNEDEETDADDTVESDDSFDEDTSEESYNETLTEEETGNTEEEVEVIEENPIVEEVEIAPVSSGSYSLIAGSFQEKQNAQDLSQSLQQQGYEGAINESDGIYRVTIKSFGSKNDAFNYRETVSSEFPSAWVKRN